MPDWLFALISLSAMEIILGIDNIIFITILVSKLKKEQQRFARNLGLLAALGTRLLLLFTLAWLAGMTSPLFHWSDFGVPKSWLKPKVTVEAVEKKGLKAEITAKEIPMTEERAELEYQNKNEVSLRDLVLILGGLFLIVKSTMEIHHKFAEAGRHEDEPKPAGNFAMVIAQIAVVDIVFSLDSVITAVGMANQIWVMVTAMIISMVVMVLSAGPIGDFVSRNPTMKMLALSFLILIGVMLLVDGFGQHIDRGYVYFAMGFSVVVEFLNLRLRKSPAPSAPSA
jgi:predicted tellurium resistance membrane protein TerC